MFWGAYGTAVFRCINSPHTVTDQQSWRIAEHPLLQKYPALEHMGPEVRRMTLEIDLLRRFCLPLTPDIIYGMFVGWADRAEVHSLIIGIQYIGDFVIQRIESKILGSDLIGLTRHRAISLDLWEVRK